MKINLPLIATALCLSYGINAQTSKVSSNSTNNDDKAVIKQRTCGTGIPSAEWDEWFNKKVEEYKIAKAANKVQSTAIVIPVIVHVIHGGQNVGVYPNLKQGQIKSQIQVLNADYSGTGLNVGNVPSVFSSLVANTGISFCLAAFDTTGALLPEPGIDRINYVTKGWANPAAAAYNTPSTFQNYIDNTIKPATIWNPTRYMNIWITDENVNTGLLGYATFPSGSTLSGISGNGYGSNDGLWCWSKAFGSNSIFPGGAYDPTYNKGRTATHEIGHWLGLRHIWGDDGTGCGGTDYCADTPNQADENYGCPNFATNISCSNAGDMAMNFMDYTDDPCMYMFTPDQNARMQTAMANGYYRSLLGASSATLCGNAPALTYTIPANDCITTEISVINPSSTGDAPLAYSWAANPSTGVVFNSNTSPNPTITFATPGTYTITSILSNGFGADTVSKVIQINSCVGLKENSVLGKNIRLIPNPSTGLVNLVTTLPNAQALEVMVHNSLGQLVSTTKYDSITNNTLSMDLSTYSNGVYFVTISNGQEKTVVRLILNK